MEARQIAILLVSIVLGFCFSAVITPLFCLCRKIFYVPLIRKKLIQSAIRNNHIVNAKLVDEIDVQRSNGVFGSTDTNEVIGVYKYMSNGKTYTYKTISRDRMPEEIELYYIKKPGKASTGGELGIRESNWPLYYFALLIIFSIVCYCFGVNYFS